MGPEGWKVRQQHFETITGLVRASRTFFPEGAAAEIWLEFRFGSFCLAYSAPVFIFSRILLHSCFYAALIFLDSLAYYPVKMRIGENPVKIQLGTHVL